MGDMFINSQFDVRKIVQRDVEKVKLLFDNSVSTSIMSNSSTSSNANQGTTVESSGNSFDVEKIEKQEFSMNINNIIDNNFTTDELKNKFKDYLNKQQNITIQEDGTVVITDTDSKEKYVKVLNNAIKDFYKENAKDLIDPNAKKVVTFNQGTDNHAIQQLLSKDIIEKVPGSNDQYTIKNEQEFNRVFSADKESNNPTYDSTSSITQQDVNLNTKTTITEVRKEIEIPKDILVNEESEKSFTEQVKGNYEKFVEEAKEIPERQSAIDTYVALTKYGDKIEKVKKELDFKKVAISRNGKDHTTLYDLVDMYKDECLSEEEKNNFKSLVDKLSSSTDENDQAAIKKALEGNGYISANKDLQAELSDDDKKIGATLLIAQSVGLDKDFLKDSIALKRVMSGRSDAQVNKDNEYFIEKQTEEFVRNKKTEKKVESTEVHFSKDEKNKASKDDNKTHTVLTKNGRRLVSAAPEMFCDKVDDNSVTKEDPENGIFKVGNAFYKFSSDKYKVFIGILCDRDSVTDEMVEKAYGTNKDDFIKDNHLTLEDGRESIKDIKIKCKDGNYSLEAIIGKANDVVGNMELNRVRRMAKVAGYSVDENKTTKQRALHIAKQAAIGAAIGTLTGGLGSLAAGSVSITGTTAAQFLHYAGVTPDRTIYDTTTFDYFVNGEQYTQTVNKEIIVEGQEYSGEVVAKGQAYSGSGNTYLETTGYAAGIGGLVGALSALKGLKNINDPGSLTDIIFNPYQGTIKTEDDIETVQLEFPQVQEVTKLSGTIEIQTEKEIDKLKVVPYQGPAAYAGLYEDENGNPVNPSEFAKAYKQKTGVNTMTKDYFYAFDTLTLGSKTFKRKDSYKDEYKKIRAGQKGNVKDKQYNNTKVNENSSKTIKVTVTRK